MNKNTAQDVIPQINSRHLTAAPGKNKFESMIRTIVIIFALMISGVTMGIQLEAGLGSAPITTLANGIADVSGLENGMASILLNVTILIPAFVFIRKKLGLGTILCAILFGAFCDLSVHLFNLSVIGEWSYMNRFIATLAATFIQAYGICLYVSVDMGLGGLEALITYLTERFKLSWSAAKILFESLLLGLGILLGGAFGLGTIMNYILSGFLMQLYFKNTNKLSERVTVFSRKYSKS